MQRSAFVAALAVAGAAQAQAPPTPATAAPGNAVLPDWAKEAADPTPPPPPPPPSRSGDAPQFLTDALKPDPAGPDAAGYRSAGFPAEPPKPGSAPAVVRITGFMAPLVVYSHRNAAVPRDRVTFGMISTRLGLRLSGNPVEHWSYFAEVGFDASVLNNRSGAARTVADVDFAAGRARFDFLTAVPVEQVTLTYAPVSWYSLTVGRMRAPFSVGHGATITAQMFPTRPGPTSVFMNGSDEGVLNTFTFLEDRVQIRAGAFDGSSLGLQLPDTTSIGPVVTGFADVHPLGKMPAIESDSGRGKLRFAAGVGTLYRIGTLFDNSGYEATRFRDFRLSAALRVAFRGVFLQGEYLRRLQTDDLSLRPASAQGYYAQAAWYLPLSVVAFAPIARLGRSVADTEFAPQETTTYEAGVIFYPRADGQEPDAIRITLQYAGERRLPADETSNGAILQMLMKW